MFSSPAGERIALVALVVTMFVVCFLAFVFSSQKGREQTIIGVPYGQAQTSSALVREYVDAPRTNGRVHSEGTANGGGSQDPIPSRAVPY